MGIAGAGNSGPLLATLAAPRLAERFGWAATFGLMLVPVLLVALVFALLREDSPRSAQSTWRDYAEVLRSRRVWFSCAAVGWFSPLSHISLKCPAPL